MHFQTAGGNIALSIFLSPGQALIEGVFGRSMEIDPTMYAHASVGNGVLYRAVYVSNCYGQCMKSGGDVDIKQAVGAISNAIDLLPNPFKVDDRDKYSRGRHVAGGSRR